ETQQAEAEIQQLQINLAKATTAEEQDRIKKQIQIKKDIIAKLAIQDKYEKEKQRIADISAAKELAIKVKAAEMQKKLSIAQTLLETPLAAMRAYSSAQVFPPPAGPIVGGIMAAAATALGMAKIALIRSTPLPAAAEGGIIPGSAGGTALIAGEGGRSEAIIPFENEEAMEQLGGAGGITVNINIENAIMDTDEFPQTIALHIDKALYDLKRNNLSLALG
ncbi:hypothetical protein, partial [Pseudoalteromonas sp.]|uniref:hypothetical protein n=1 Tax=Pseudoalteromonas sp. TaxID=53249 RepID=UPI00262A41DF